MVVDAVGMLCGNRTTIYRGSMYHNENRMMMSPSMCIVCPSDILMNIVTSFVRTKELHSPSLSLTYS